MLYTRQHGHSVNVREFYDSKIEVVMFVIQLDGKSTTSHRNELIEIRTGCRSVGGLFDFQGVCTCMTHHYNHNTDIFQ